jgi:hypothetical protein
VLRSVTVAAISGENFVSDNPVTLDQARAWIIKASLILTGSYLAFLIAAPAFRYPLSYSESIRLIEIITPVFFAYLGSATYSLFGPPRNEVRLRNPALLSLLVKGPLFLFGGVGAVAFVAFGVSNRPPAIIGSGMGLDTLSGILTITLGLLTVTTNVIVQYLFGRHDQPAAGRRQGDSIS